jgi:putative heme-binding domain-containing protein
MRVRLRAQLALAENPANRDILIAATNAGEPLTTRLHGVWGLGNLARLKKDDTAAVTLVNLCSDSDAKVRGQAAQAIGDAGYKPGIIAAVGLLTDPDLRTRMLSAITVGKLGSKEQIPALMSVVGQNNDKDEYVRHGAIQGMILIGDADAVFAFADHKSPAVRRAVVLALRRFKDARIGSFLKDADLSIAVETVQAINDEYIEGAREALAAATHLLGKSTWAVDLRILNAMIRAGGDENVHRLLAVAADTSLSEDARTEALWLIGRYENHPPTDPTTGMYRPITEERTLNDGTRGEIRKAVETQLRSATGNLLVEAMSLAAKFDVKIPQEVLLAQLKGKGIRTDIRLAALKRLESEAPEDFPKELAALTADSDAQIRGAALESLGRLSPDLAFGVVTGILSSGKPDDRQRAIALLSSLKHPEAATTLLELLKKLPDQAAAVQLDILNAAAKQQQAEFKTALAEYEAGLDKEDPLAAFHVAREGGNVDNGRRIFYNSGAANCIQCHKIGQRAGGAAGPALDGIGKRRDAAYILESIVAPAAKLSAGYSPIAVTMNDGSIVAGMLMKETDSEVVVRNIETNQETVCRKADIKTLPPAVSTMPPMGALLTKSEIRDLVAFLSSQK